MFASSRPGGSRTVSSASQVDPSLLNRGHRGGNPKVNSGGRQRGVSAGATASIEADASPTVRGGRGRGSKRSAFYAGLASYDSHFASLISMELMYEKVSLVEGAELSVTQ